MLLSGPFEQPRPVYVSPEKEISPDYILISKRTIHDTHHDVESSRDGLGVSEYRGAGVRREAVDNLVAGVCKCSNSLWDAFLNICMKFWKLDYDEGMMTAKGTDLT